MKVKNQNGTATKSCRCGSWKEHWARCAGTVFPKECKAYGCTNSAEVGAHVMKHASVDNKSYIVPFCRACNNISSSEVITLNAGTNLVWANKQQTCS